MSWRTSMGWPPSSRTVPAASSAFATATSSSGRSTTALSVIAYVAMGLPPAANYTGLPEAQPGPSDGRLTVPAGQGQFFALALHLHLIPDRQAADPFSGRREDRVAERRRGRRHARLAPAAHPPAVVAADAVHTGIPRRPRPSGQLRCP